MNDMQKKGVAILLAEIGLTKEKANEILGWGENTINRYVSGENDMSCDKLNRLLDFAIEKNARKSTINMLLGGYCEKSGYGKLSHG